MVAHLVADLVLDPERIRARFDARLRAERGEVWFEAHREMLDAQWAILVECVF